MSDEPEFPVSDPRISVTTVNPTGDKASVAGYGDSPMLELHDGVLCCEYCGYNRFRRSRVRAADLLEILRLRFPMRCMRCSQRQFHDVNLAFLSIAPKARGPKITEQSDSWQDWTKSSPETPLSTRPMTTAVGTRAQKLAKPVAAAAQTPAAQVQGRRRGDNEIW